MRLRSHGGFAFCATRGKVPPMTVKPSAETPQVPPSGSLPAVAGTGGVPSTSDPQDRMARAQAPAQTPVQPGVRVGSVREALRVTPHVPAHTARRVKGPEPMVSAGAQTEHLEALETEQALHAETRDTLADAIDENVGWRKAAQAACALVDELLDDENLGPKGLGGAAAKAVRTKLQNIAALLKSA